MEKLVVDVSVIEKLRTIQSSTELCDANGTVVGVFIPTGLLSRYEVEDPPSDDELSRIDRGFRGRPLDEILHGLQTTP
jgi:hypothetical protein